MKGGLYLQLPSCLWHTAFTMKHLSLSLVIALLPMTVSAAGFSDVPTSHPTYDAINYVQTEGIVSGYPDGTYKPKNTVNRAELTKIIIGSLFDPEEIDTCDTENVTFSDVSDDAWYLPYLCVAVENRIISGYQDNTFRGGNTVNLAEASKIITMGFFEDIDQSGAGEWYTPYIEVLADVRALPTGLKTVNTGLSRGDLADIVFRIDAEVDTQPSLDVGDLIASYDDQGDGEDFAMEESDCLEDEVYDAREQVCYVEIECDTEAECEAKMAAIDAEAESIEDAGDDYQEFDQESAETPKATYKVTGDTITPVGSIAPSDDTRYRAIWSRFITLFPMSAREDVTQFEISTDGKEGTLAAVYALEDNPEKWAVVVDDADAFTENGSMNTEDLTYSLIHEVAHLVSLNAREVPPQATDDMEAAKDDCAPRYFTGEGCSLEKSMINLFFQSFWKQIYATYGDVFDNEEGNAPNIYSKNPGNFVSDYAATNPGEDFAESFAEFVLNDRNKTPATIADQKKDFFYDHSSLVTLRTVIRQRLTLVE